MEIELLSFNEAVNTFNPFWALCLAVLYFVVELLDSGLVFSLTQHKAERSALITFVLYLVIAIEITAIITNYLYVVPIAVGAAFGSYVAVKHERKKRPLK